MELTYENMMAHIEEYFDLVSSGTKPAIDPQADPQIRDKLEDFFAPDFTSRAKDASVIRNREQWLEHLCGTEQACRYEITYKGGPFYIIIDDRKKMAAGLCRERVKHPVTGELLREFLLNVHFGFTVVDGAVKFKSAFSADVPAKFQVDSLPG